jgi:hypothetical protein
MSEFSRRKLWVPLLAAQAVRGADGALGVATGQAGETAFEFIASASQNGSNFTATGYLTAIAGLPETALFTDPVIRSQNTARFTFAATAQLVSRNVLDVLFVLDEVGTFAISYSENAGGTPPAIATGSVQLQTTVQVTTKFSSAQSPGKGNLRATGEFVRTATQVFTLGSIRYEFGDTTHPWLITAVGDGTLTDPAVPVSQITLAGSATVGPRPPKQ